MSVMDHELWSDAEAQLLGVLQKTEGKMRLGMVADGSVHPQSLIETLVSLRADNLLLRHQLMMLSALMDEFVAGMNEATETEFVRRVCERLKTQTDAMKAEAAAKESRIVRPPPNFDPGNNDGR